jgi:hypothetical protein
MTTTLAALQAGSMPYKLVCAIEGCRYIASDAPAAAVITAWAGTDWTDAANVIVGLRVNLENEQRITPWTVFPQGSDCQIRVLDTTDAFGTFINKRAAGAETTLTATVDRNDTTLNVAGTTNFTASGECYIGTECIGYSAKAATTLTVSTRGKYSPFGCSATGSGGARFANHHRVGAGSDRVQLEPVVSQLPRVWIGKRVGVWMHTWNDATQTMNVKADAQLIYSGRIAGISESGLEIVLDLSPVHDELRDGVIGKNLLHAEIAGGMWFPAGRKFNFADRKTGSYNAADALEVVAGTPASTNEMQEGYYLLEEFAAILSAWLAGEKNASRILGYYTLASPVSTKDGIRTRVQWRIEDASDIDCGFGFAMPAEYLAFLGLTDSKPEDRGVTRGWARAGVTNVSDQADGESAPYTTIIFKPSGPSRLGQEFAEPLPYELVNIRGSFIDQQTRLPASVKASTDTTHEWGLFLLDEKALIVGAYDDGVITNCWLAPFQLTADNDAQAMAYIGRRADDPGAGPVTVRQILMLVGPYAELMQEIVYSSGTAGYNHGTRDALGYGLGLGIPGSQLGYEFERSLTNLPCANHELQIRIDEPTTFQELVASDFKIRRAFFRWKDQGFEVCQWRTPTAAIATVSLTEANKAAPTSRAKEDHRSASQETSEHVRGIVKFDFAQDFVVGRDGRYLKSVQLEDQTAVDDAGGGVKSTTLKMRNTYTQWANSGAGLEEMLAEFLAFMPAMSRPQRSLNRSIAQVLYESISIGDVALVYDNYARDPLNGTRGIDGRAAFVTRVNYNLAANEGDVDLYFMDVHRSETYAPAAQVDDTASAGGFSAGYNNATSTLRCYEHKYSHTLTLTTKRGTTDISEAADAENFAAGDMIVIVERDNDVPGYLYWEREILSVSGNDITLTSGISAPAWDATKTYVITYQTYSACTSTQQDKSFQADDTDMMIEDEEVPYHYASTAELNDYTVNAGDEKGEFVPDVGYGDGKPLDVAHERALINTINAYIDRKSAHQAPFLWNTASQANLGGGDNTVWRTLLVVPIFFGFEHLSATVTRTLTVAPFWSSSSGGVSSWLRITLTRSLPTDAPSVAIGEPTGGPFGDPIFPGEYSQSSEYGPTTSTTYATGADAELSLSVKDLQFGFAWIVIEGAGAARCRGLAKCIEGARTVG